MLNPQTPAAAPRSSIPASKAFQSLLDKLAPTGSDRADRRRNRCRGKEVVARYLPSPPSRVVSGRFSPLTAARSAKQQREAGLFGHEKGAFTGAVQNHPGWFREAAERRRYAG